ncbi:MAG: transcriptional regulator [Candidatus Delongbacteria bacterium]|nr:transcriptional regulator [Candidatus Delongbacteria bacterium]
MSKSEDAIIELFTSINDRDLMRRFFDEIFTAAERRDLSLRWELMQQLKEGRPQREIATRLGISLCKITRGAKIVKNSNSATSSLLNSNTRRKGGEDDARN